MNDDCELLYQRSMFSRVKVVEGVMFDDHLGILSICSRRGEMVTINMFGIHLTSMQLLPGTLL